MLRHDPALFSVRFNQVERDDGAERRRWGEGGGGEGEGEAATAEGGEGERDGVNGGENERERR